MLKVLKIPYQKHKSSDELNEVDKLPLVFNELCQLMMLEITAHDEANAEDQEIAMAWDCIRTLIADTITEIASQGV